MALPPPLLEKMKAALESVRTAPESADAHLAFFTVLRDVGQAGGLAALVDFVMRWFEACAPANRSLAVDRLAATSPKSPILRHVSHVLMQAGFADEAVRAFSHSCWETEESDLALRVADLEDKFAAIAQGYDETRLHQLTAQQFIAFLEQGVTFRPGLGVLDVGCGTGLVGQWLKPKVAWLEGVDLSPNMIEQARAKGIYDVLSVEEASAALASADRKDGYDLIVSNWCLFYLPDLKEFFRGAASALAPGGQLAVTAYSCWDERDVMRKDPPLEYAHSRAYLRRMGAESGLAEDRIETKHLCTFPGYFSLFSKR